MNLDKFFFTMVFSADITLIIFSCFYLTEQIKLLKKSNNVHSQES